MLDEVPQPGAPPKIRGSVMLAMAESKEAVLEKLKEDVYLKVRPMIPLRPFVYQPSQFPALPTCLELCGKIWLCLNYSAVSLVDVSWPMELNRDQSANVHRPGRTTSGTGRRYRYTLLSAR